MIVLIKALQVILSLSVLIFIHELGHFAWAKIFGIRVEKFYLFFDVGGKRLARWKWGGTEFGIGWLPLGGYCKISGMIDESMDMEQLKSEPKEWEYRSHPAWHRMFVLAGGVLNNFLFAVVVYCVIMGVWGKSYISNENTRIYVNELSYEMGFRTGDRILKFDDYEPRNFEMLQAELARKDVRKATVLRGTDTLDIYIDRNYIGDVMNTPGVFAPAIPFVIDSVQAGSANGSLLYRGDRIIGINGEPTEYLQDARKVLADCPGTLAQAVVVKPQGDTVLCNVAVDSLGRLGVFCHLPEIKYEKFSGLAAIPAGIRHTGEVISSYLEDLRLLVTPSTGAYKSVGSFIAIGQVMPEQWNWLQFVNILALLSIMLGVMNLLPIPGLDGGHLLITLGEMLTGKKPSDKFLYVAQLIGMALLIGLMLLAFGNDIGRLIH
ncbi:MAG: RIP metalloprotease RseP [Bacteroidales bacterium]|nr:RIP metalloprotease RseP [Candidatus Cryptobacteroides fimicaballi]